MCGIAGIVYKNALSDPKAALHTMLDAMAHMVRMPVAYSTKK